MAARKRYEFSEAHKDHEFLEASKRGIDGRAEFYEKKLVEAEASGDEEFIYDALYEVIASQFMVLVKNRYRGSRKKMVAAAQRMLEVKPPRLQLSVFSALTLFRSGEPKLALKLIEHGYLVITNAESAFDNVTHLLQSRQLLFAIHTKLNPRSRKARKYLEEVWHLGGPSYNSVDAEQLEAMEALNSIPMETWRDAYIRECVLTSMRNKIWLAQQVQGKDRSEEIARIDALLDAIPELACPMSEGLTTGHAKRLP